MTRTNIVFPILLISIFSNAQTSHLQDSLIWTIFKEIRIVDIFASKMYEAEKQIFLLATKETESMIPGFDSVYKEMVASECHVLKYTSVNEVEIFLFFLPDFSYHCLNPATPQVVFITKLRHKGSNTVDMVLHTTTLTQKRKIGYPYLRVVCGLSWINGRWRLINAKVRNTNFIRIVQRQRGMLSNLP